MVKTLKIIGYPFFALIVACFILYLVSSHKEYLHYKSGAALIMPANDCYADCAKSGFFGYSYCVIRERCSWYASHIN